MKKALIVIDYIVDFVESDGKLSCGSSAQIIDRYVSAHIDAFTQAGECIIVVSDSHSLLDTYNPESKLFPPHCIEGSRGCHVYGQASLALEQTPAGQKIDIAKTRYSAFAGTTLDLKLRERDIKDIYLVGLCSDICVLHTAIDAYNLGYNIYIYQDAIASFSLEGHAFALAHFKNALGATIL